MVEGVVINMKTMNLKKIIIAVAILAAVLMLPWPCPYSRTLEATKFDNNGNNLGTVEISMKGFKTHSILFGARLYTATVGAFEDYAAEKWNLSGFNGGSPFFDYRYQSKFITGLNHEGDWSHAVQTGNMDNLTSYAYGYTLAFSSDYDRWKLIMTPNEGKYFYVGSFSGAPTTEELLEYFDVTFGRSSN